MPTIEFTSYNPNTLKYSKPILASKVQPEWWKKMRINEIVRGDKQQTIRACPAMQDWLTMGYYLVAETDIVVQVGQDLNSDGGTQTSAWSYEQKKIGSSSHPDTQFGNAMEPEKRAGLPVKDAFKFRNPWNIKTPDGYSTLYLDPFLHQNQHFSVWPGIIDTDKFNLNMDNAQIIFYPKVDHSFIIKKGTPIVQIIPFRREEWSSSAQIKEPQSFIDNLSDITSPYKEESGSKFSHSLHLEYRDLKEDRNKKKKQLQDVRNDGSITSKSAQAAINESNLLEDGGLGPYRKLGMHVSKSKLFGNAENKLEIPPECPMHVSEESNEIQLEMDFGDKDAS
mgnify:FL=1